MDIKTAAIAATAAAATPVAKAPEQKNAIAIVEPLLTEANPTAKFLLFPLRTKQDEALYKFYLQAVHNFWVADEIPFKKDCEQYKTLTKGQKTLLDAMLAFFASADGIIVENLAAHFLTEVKHPIARAFYAQQIGVEQIHADTYSRFIYSLIPERKDQEHLFQAIDTMPSVQRKAAWAIKWLESNRSFAERLIAFACVEGIFFSGAFSVIFYFKIKLNLMSEGLGVANEMIARDEALHCDFACYLYNEMLVGKLTQAQVEEIVDECVQSEKEFIGAAIPVGMIGMTAEMMQKYIEFCADRLLVALGCAKKYKVENPFPWMVSLSLYGKSNFFEKRVSEYGRSKHGWELTAKKSKAKSKSAETVAGAGKATATVAAAIASPNGGYVDTLDF